MTKATAAFFVAAGVAVIAAAETQTRVPLHMGPKPAPVVAPAAVSPTTQPATSAPAAGGSSGSTASVAGARAAYPPAATYPNYPGDGQVDQSGPASTPQQDAAPVVVTTPAVDDFTQINWLPDPSHADPAKPTWTHYWGDNCTPCRVEALAFTDVEAVRLSRSFNCFRVKLADGSTILRDVFDSPTSMDASQRSSRELVGWAGSASNLPQNGYLLAKRLYDNWNAAMQRSVVESRTVGPVRRMLTR